MTATVEDLQAENAWLKDRIKALSGEAAKASIMSALGLTPQQAKMLGALLAHPEGIPSDALYAEVFEDPATGDGPGYKILHVQMHALRQRLRRRKAAGEIQTLREFGYRMDARMRAWITHATATIAEEIAA